MEVVGVRVEMPSNQPIVLLKEIDGNRFLPIWVGANEASAIAFAQQGLEHACDGFPQARPSGHMLRSPHLRQRTETGEHGGLGIRQVHVGSLVLGNA